MKLYNTLSKKIEDFVPHDLNNVKMYTCGPTVYHYAHIGNLRTYITEDVLEKGLKFLGYNVTRVMNITDVGHLTSDSDSGEDKMLKGARREHKSVLEIADSYTKAFMNDCNDLNITWPSIVSKATDNIDEYIKIIKRLIEKDYAYVSGGNVYFDVSKLDDYYALTNHKEDEMVVGARVGVEEDSNKKNQADFALWFTKSKFEDQELKWDSPWGVGYPGWHIECSGISMKFLGEYLDIHCGGVDNIFPHHTNEIAQSEAYLGHKWCNYWVHGEHLNDESGKMSKSKGEFLTVSLLKDRDYMPLSYRYFCLNANYRKTLVFSWNSLDIAQNAYQKLRKRTSRLTNDGERNIEIEGQYIEEFKNSFSNDINTPMMLTLVYEVMKDKNLSDYSKRVVIEQFDRVLSLDLLIPINDIKIDDNLSEYIENKIKERNEAKENRDFELADKIRNELKDKGILIKDTREGTVFEIVK